MGEEVSHPDVRPNLPDIELPPLPPADLEAAAEPRLNLKEVSKAYHTRVRDELAKLYVTGASGHAVVEMYTRQIDRLISYLFHAAARLYAQRNPRLFLLITRLPPRATRCCTPNPYSDVD